MSERIFFKEPSSSSTDKGKAPESTSTTKPADDFTPLAPTPGTILYLAVIKPHTDTHTIHGPVKKFIHLLPQIEDIVSNSPSAIDKLTLLKEGEEDVWGEREPNRAFEATGFDTFVVDGQRGVFTVLKILREQNADVYGLLPAPAYTVITAGPLTIVPTYAGNIAVGGSPTGYATTTCLVGSFVDRGAAQSAAREKMGELVKGVDGVRRTETWEKGGMGGGLLMAMSPGVMWEVKVVYEDQALRRAREGFDREGEEVGWRF